MPFRLVVLLALAVPAAGAQANGSYLTPGLGVTAPPAHGFGPDWAPSPGLSGRVAAPVYGGLVRAALDVRAFTASRDDLPDFRLAAASLGWGPTVALPRDVRLSGGVLAGLVNLRFETLDGIPFQNTIETEASVGAWARVDVPVAGRVRVWTEAEALRVALSGPVAVVSGAAGVAVRLDTPGWLRDVLR